MNDTFQDLMREATRLTGAGSLNEATEAIQRALNGAAGPGAVPRHTNSHARAAGIRATEAALPAPPSLVLDDCVFEVDARAPAAAATVITQAPQSGLPAAARNGRGEFTSGTHTHASQTYGYKLYAPPDHFGGQLPLVVMLHGCTQDPDDFAAGTGMNEFAREQGFFVLYPAQSQAANPSRCWNWFKHNHQRRASGEPALLAGMTQAVIKQHGIDARRVYIAGLSAGGAMAAIVAAAYPEIFAAVGVHSGLPCGAASDVAGALAVMKSGVAGPAALHAKGNRFSTPPAAANPRVPVPTIVFHGDQDRTVHPRNGEQVIAAVLGSAGATGHREPASFPAGSPRVEHGVSSLGRRYTRSLHHDGNGNALAEHWIVHGAGHAWSGGDAKGSYTDAKGPDATREMLRFFFEQPHGLGN